MTGAAERQVLEMISEASPAKVICQMCQRFQESQGKLPTAIAVNAQLHSKIGDIFSYCAPIHFFVASEMTQEKLPDATWLLVLDVDNIVREKL